MTDRQQLAIKYSWSFVTQDSIDAALLFYGKLFELKPELKPLFKDDIGVQAQKLVAMITAVVSQLQRMDELSEQISALGKRHGGYGVQAHHYPAVGEALIWMLEQRLQEQWSPETREAWLLLYQLLSDKMIRAVNTAESSVNQ
jgi:hemoglobin-like flavoprotein